LDGAENSPSCLTFLVGPEAASASALRFFEGSSTLAGFFSSSSEDSSESESASEESSDESSWNVLMESYNVNQADRMAYLGGTSFGGRLLLLGVRLGLRRVVRRVGL